MNKHILCTPFVNKPIDKIKNYHIEDWWKEYLADSYAGSTINAILTIMSNIFSFALKREWIGPNPIDTVEWPQTDSFKPDPYSLDDVEIILKNFDPFFYDYQQSRFFRGFRSSEINAIEPHHFDVQRRTVNIVQSIVHGRFDKPKNKFSKRTVNLNDRIYESFVRQLDKARNLGSKTLFFTKKGNPIDNARYNHSVWKPFFSKKEIKDSNIRYRHCRCSRHTYISLALDAGEKPTYVATQVGHSNARTLFEHYAAYIHDENDGKKLNAKLTQNLHN